MTSLLEASALCLGDRMQNALLSFVIYPSEGVKRGGCGGEIGPWVIPGVDTHPTTCGIRTTWPWSAARCVNGHMSSLGISEQSRVSEGERKHEASAVCFFYLCCFLRLSFQGLSLNGNSSCFFGVIGRLCGPSLEQRSLFFLSRNVLSRFQHNNADKKYILRRMSSVSREVTTCYVSCLAFGGFLQITNSCFLSFFSVWMSNRGVNRVDLKEKNAAPHSIQSSVILKSQLVLVSDWNFKTRSTRTRLHRHGADRRRV